MSTPRTVRAALLAAAERIRTGGWCRGDLGDVCGNGPVCAIGAIESVCGTGDTYVKARKRLSAYLEGANIIEWNDDLPRRTGKGKVIAALTKAADFRP